MSDDIAEQIVGQIEAAKDEAREEIADADDRADVIARLDGIESRLAAAETATPVPATMPEHDHPDIVSKLDDLLEKVAAPVEDIAEPVVGGADDVIDTTADTGGEVADVAAEPVKKATSPERRHGLFSRPFARRGD